jgi:response regulator RpfG family c-di-GMP phosphodiesterase
METRINAPKVLIVDDEIGPRESLRMILKPHYNVFTVENGYAAIQMIQQMDLDVVTLDLKMPGISGIETLREMRRVDPDVMVIIITGYGTLQSAIDSIRFGVFDYIAKPFNVPEIIQIIEKSVQRKRLNGRIKEFLKTFHEESARETGAHTGLLLQNGLAGIAPQQWNDMGLSDNRNCLEFAKVLVSTLEEKDPYTSGHSSRVCYYSDVVSKRLALLPKDRDEIQIASYLHDIGKVGISDRFINKKGTLTSTDWAIIRQHTRKSIELLAPLRLSSNILSFIQHHHEHFDGTGYPDGLAGERIPLGARIIAISDAYDSMTSARPYRKPLPNFEARSELRKWSGKQFDPQLVSTFSDIIEEIDETFLLRNQTRVSHPLSRESGSPA